MQNFYDVIIVGAGPCGLFSALELMKSKKIAIIEAGLPVSEKKCLIEEKGFCQYCRPVCNILGGFGGAQFFEGTKLSRYPAGSGLLTFCKNIEDLEKLYDYVDTVLEKYGKSKRVSPQKKEIEKLKNLFDKIGINLKYYNAQKISKLTMNKIAQNIFNELTREGVDIFLKEQVLEIKGKKGNFSVLTEKNSYQAKKILFSVGRIGSRQLLKISDKIGIEYSEGDQQIEIGVRVEMPSNIFRKIDNLHNDLKLVRKISDNEEVRSFCQDYKGYITKCVYNLPGDKIISSLDGHIIGTDQEGGKMSEVVNIGIHHRFSSQDRLGDIYDLIAKINHNGKPVTQTMKGYLLGFLDTNFNSELSLKDVEFADINNYLPLKTNLLIKDFVYRLDRVLPGFAADGNAVYAPSFEMGWKKMTLTNNFETTVPGIYIGGDVTGHFRGAMQSAVSGVMIAKILNEEN